MASYSISSCSTHRPLSTDQITFESGKPVVDGRTDGRTSSLHLILYVGVDLKRHFLMLCTTSPIATGRMIPGLPPLKGPLLIYQYPAFHTGPENAQMILLTTGWLQARILLDPRGAEDPQNLDYTTTAVTVTVSITVYIYIFVGLSEIYTCLNCFDAVCWVTGRASRL